MLPRKKYPSNSRSFFTSDGRKPLGMGLEVWRGYFQSLRPAVGRLLLNVDISAAAMYRSGPLIDVCMDFFGFTRPAQLQPQNMNDVQKRRLGSFLRAVKVTTRHTGRERTETVQKIVWQSPSSLRFDHPQYGDVSVADYFRRQFNLTLAQRTLMCVQVRFF